MVSEPNEVSLKEPDKLVSVLEKRVEHLRSTYDQYFQGLERVEPLPERADLRRQILQIRTIQSRNTGLRFRINQLVAKFNVYEDYWNRVARQVEEGTYSREIAMAHYRLKKRTERDADREKISAAAPSPKHPPTEKPDADAASSGATVRNVLTDDKLSAIYEAYVKAKRRCQENVNGLTKEVLASSIKKQVSVIMTKHNCKSIEFKVLIKDGKAVLKVLPK
jgi:hypothetical protein